MVERKDRLELFIKLFFDGNKSELQRGIEFVTGKKYARQNFNTLLNKGTLPQDVIDGLYKLGLNISWYLYDEGEMFALNDAGQDLKKEFETDEKMKRIARAEFILRTGNSTIDANDFVLERKTYDPGKEALEEVKKVREEIEQLRKDILGDRTLPEEMPEMVKVAAGRVGQNKQKK